MKTHSLSARKFIIPSRDLPNKIKLVKNLKIKNYQLLNKYKDLKKLYFYIFTTTK